MQVKIGIFTVRLEKQKKRRRDVATIATSDKEFRNKAATEGERGREGASERASEGGREGEKSGAEM